MMRVLKWLLGIVLGLALVFVVGGFLLPREANVSREITVNASPAQVFSIVNDMRRFNEWSPWADLDPETRYTFSGPDTGVGSSMSWHSDDPSVGSGTQTITEVDADRRVVTALDFGDMGQGTAQVRMEPRGSQTLVTWHFHTDFGNSLMFRWMGLVMDRMLGPSYEDGLTRLKIIAEHAASNPAPEVQ